MGQSPLSLFHLLTGDSQPSNQAAPPAAVRQSAFYQVLPNRPHPCLVVHRLVFAVSNSFAASLATRASWSWSLGTCVRSSQAKPQRCGMTSQLPSIPPLSSRLGCLGGPRIDGVAAPGTLLSLGSSRVELRGTGAQPQTTPGGTTAEHSHSSPYSASLPPLSRSSA
jgi:hypothetical protein